MINARPHVLLRAFALLLVLAALAAGGRGAAARDGGAEAGVVISNRAEAVYYDADGTGFRTVSPIVSVTVVAVSGLVVTPDETEASAAVAPNERVTRLFRVCNTGNTPDIYTLTRADVSAPATLHSLHFDVDATGTLTDADRAVQLNATMSPRLARGECAGVLAVVDTNASQPQSQINISVVARSNVLGTVNGAVEDMGTIINDVGNGARLTSPDDPKLPPSKLVEGLERVTAAHGQTLNYLVSFRNSGDVTARRVVLRDDLPDGLEYVAGSLRLGTKQLTDAEDADEGLFRERHFEVRLPEVKIDETVRVTFQARVTTGVAPGEGVVNTAKISADNAALASSTAATAVVNPFGLVYEGRGGSASTIPGARVALLADSTTGATVPLPTGGTLPNEANTNPYLSDGQGRWSFALSPAQLGGADSPARYFLNVTAQGFRARMIEATVTPQPDSGGLFTLTVRALDGQPVARGGSFELTTEGVSIPRLAALALNVPMFENSAIEIQKTADRPAAEVGEVVTYRVEVRNATDSAVSDVVVNDTLPPSFHYAQGSARVDLPPAGPRPIEPEAGPGGLLIFRLGTLPAGARASLVYRVRIGANASEGEQFNSASAVGSVALTGERVTTEPARAPVRVRRGVFSTQQVIIGRVYEDANANGAFDSGERPLAGVRLYLNNGQSVITDSAGQYNFPTVGEGSHVISLDPLTLPPGYAVSNANRREQTSWTRLLRTPLGGGAMLRQNFALLPPADSAVSSTPSTDHAASTGASVDAPASASLNYAQSGSAARRAAGQQNAAANSTASEPSNGTNGASNANGANGAAESSHTSNGAEAARTPGTFEIASTETVEPVAAGKVKVLSPAPGVVVAGAALEIEARVANDWKVSVEVEGQSVSEAKIGERRVDHKNKVTTYSFVGVSVRPGPNRVTVTAVGPDGRAGETVELTAYGRGPAKRLEIVSDKAELNAGGRDRTTLRVRAFDQWGHPAADGAVSLEVSAGRLLRVAAAGGGEGIVETSARRAAEGGAPGVDAIDEAQAAAEAKSQIITLTGGEAVAELVADGAPGMVEVHATTGALAADARVRVTPEIRPTILVGLAEVSVGSAAPEISMHDSKESARSRIAFFYRGPVFGKNLLTLAYDSQRPLNRTSGSDRMFQLDPLERAYPLFGDSSTRYEDAQSNSKLYARLDRGRSYLMFGDFDTENRDAGLASYARRLTGVKLHVENSKGDFVSVTGARPDTAFARDVFAGGALGFARLTHADVMPGSEVVAIEVRDRRNPEVIISREPLVRSVDYNFNPSTGEIFFLRPVSTFDYALNLVQVVVTYEHRAGGMSSAVYTARAVKNFEGAGLKVGLSVVEQKQSEFGSFVIGGIDAEKTLPNGGRVRAEWALSRGRVLFSGNLFSAGDGETDSRHDGSALRVELEQPLPWREARLRASFLRADEGFMNPFGATVTPGSRRAEVALDMRVRPSSALRLSVTDERNKTVNVNNGRLTGSVQWTENVNDRLRATVAYDYRHFDDDTGGREVNSNLLTVGAEWQATDKLQLSVKREQNLSEADPTYPNQTTLAANYQWSQFTKLFFTQRLGSAAIVPIGDFSSTGFAVSGARRETAIGIETRLGRYANLVSRYQLENGANGSDSFAVIGLQNRFALTKELQLDLGYERGIHLAGEGESFNNLHVGFGWQPTDNFRSSARYEMRDRGGVGNVFTLGAAGRLADNLTTLARYQLSRANFQGRANSSMSAQAALAWRPLHTDRAGLLFSYTRRQLEQEGANQSGSTLDRADIISADGFYQLTNDLELYGRFALRYSDTGTPDLVRVSSLAYLTQARAAYRLGRFFDLAAETRMLFAPSSGTRRNSFGTELGYWVLPDLRLGGGYNWTGATEPSGGALVSGRRGFYFTISSKLSNLFDLFGTSRANERQTVEPDDAPGAQGSPQKEDDEEEEEEGGR